MQQTLPSLTQSCFENLCPVDTQVWHCFGRLRERVESECGLLALYGGVSAEVNGCPVVQANSPLGLDSTSKVLRLSSLNPDIIRAMDTPTLQAFLGPLARSFVRVRWVDNDRHTRTRHGFLKLARTTYVHTATAIALLMKTHSANVQMARVLAAQPDTVCADLLHLRPGRLFTPEQMRQVVTEVVAQVCRNPNDHCTNDPLRDGCAALVSQYLTYCRIIVQIEDGPGSILRKMRQQAKHGRPLPFRIVHHLGSGAADLGMNQGSLRAALGQVYTPCYTVSVDEAVQYTAITFAGTQKYVNALKQRDQRDTDVFNLAIISLLSAAARLPTPISFSAPLMGAIGIAEGRSGWKVRDLNSAMGALRVRLVERPAKAENKVFDKVETAEVAADFLSRCDLTQRSILI